MGADQVKWEEWISLFLLLVLTLTAIEERDDLGPLPLDVDNYEGCVPAAFICFNILHRQQFFHRKSDPEIAGKALQLTSIIQITIRLKLSNSLLVTLSFAL